MKKKYILIASCADTIGIVRLVSDFFYQLGSTIVEASQYTDQGNQQFFMRWEFGPGIKDLPDIEVIKEKFQQIAKRFSMNWEIHNASIKPKILIAVSKYGHCLNDLLHKWSDEHFPGEIMGVISNHEKFRQKVEVYGLPYYHFPITKANKWEQEQRVLSIMKEKEVNLLVLARYMQILSPKMCEHLMGKAINIHHSFLPSFKGAKPYHQAFDRGVKVMGATAHYVTANLDEGPIIEQDVQRIEHFHKSTDMVSAGKNVEMIVLARAVQWHCQHRILLNGLKTVIFK